MLSTPDFSLSEFTDRYHLWAGLILLSVLGAFHLAGIAISQGFRFLGDVHEAYFSYKARCAENRRRYFEEYSRRGNAREAATTLRQEI